MNRKLIELGNGCLVVSLPSKFVKKHNLKKGESVELELEDDSIKISLQEKGNKVTRKGYHLQAEEEGEGACRFCLPVFHKLGYDEVQVTFSKTEDLNAIQDRVNEMLLGYEIVEQSKNKCIIRTISREDASEFDNLLRRIFLVTLSLADSTLESLEKGNLEGIEEFLVLEQTNNKLTNYCQRLLIKKNLYGNKNPFMYLIIWLLESVGDSYRDLVVYLQHSEKKKLSLHEEILKKFKTINQYLRDYYNLFYTFNLSRLLGLLEASQATVQELYLHRPGSDDAERMLMTYLIILCQRINDFMGATYALHVQE